LFDLSAIGEVSMKIKQVRLKQEECEYDCKIIEGSNPPKSLYKKSQIFTQSPAPTVTRHPNAKIIASDGLTLAPISTPGGDFAVLIGSQPSKGPKVSVVLEGTATSIKMNDHVCGKEPVPTIGKISDTARDKFVVTEVFSLRATDGFRRPPLR
jgi:hypothetical protein